MPSPYRVLSVGIGVRTLAGCGPGTLMIVGVGAGLLFGDAARRHVATSSAADFITGSIEAIPCTVRSDPNAAADEIVAACLASRS